MTREQELEILLKEGLVSEYNVKEKWFKPMFCQVKVLERLISLRACLDISTSLSHNHPFTRGEYGTKT